MCAKFLSSVLVLHIALVGRLAGLQTSAWKLLELGGGGFPENG